ncbi:SRPBCC family protein [Paenibacillus aestuarii]|uniref:SRPBCC domain-containing protein n=1 Tax=Paenibacillus aestuarii TaxID=516965 RepID=A0ABW0K5N1_9BACL|nr:SRPBCC domain-containing protein [Paenibacillus aestuarii]
MSLTLSLDFQYTSSIEKVWSALTESGKLAQWVMDNDFKPVEGHQFQFRTQPTEWWDGVITGEVLVVDAPTRLSYTWASGGEKHTVTWTLEAIADGKVNLHLEQVGFSNAQGVQGAKYGWSKWCGELEKLLAQ